MTALPEHLTERARHLDIEAKRLAPTLDALELFVLHAQDLLIEVERLGICVDEEGDWDHAKEAALGLTNVSELVSRIESGAPHLPAARR